MSVATPEPATPRMDWRTPLIVIITGCLIAMIGFGIRSVFGLFMDPMTIERGWDRETFSLALAIQNLLWGAGVPFAGILADRFGPGRVISVGAVMYTVGVIGMAEADTPGMLHLTAGLLTGLGVAFTAFSLALAAMAKVVGPERRSLALGLGTAPALLVRWCSLRSAKASSTPSDGTTRCSYSRPQPSSSFRSPSSCRAVERPKERWKQINLSPKP